MLKLLWAPMGWTLRITAWLLFAPLGLYLSWRKGRNRRHHEIVHAIRQTS